MSVEVVICLFGVVQVCGACSVLAFVFIFVDLRRLRVEYFVRRCILCVLMDYVCMDLFEVFFDCVV